MDAFLTERGLSDIPVQQWLPASAGGTCLAVLRGLRATHVGPEAPDAKSSADARSSGLCSKHLASGFGCKSPAIHP